MKLKPWYDVVKPREDLREGKSQDASEFAVHLDRVRDGTARADYGNGDEADGRRGTTKDARLPHGGAGWRANRG